MRIILLKKHTIKAQGSVTP